MKHLFSIKEFLITRPKSISVDIADKIFWNHIIPMIPVRNALNIPITASSYSGYRPKWWEKKRNRSGNSQHVFEEKGAVDWTCKDFETNKDSLLSLIIKHTEYTRICVYDSFLHCDYKSVNTRQLFKYSNSTKKWVFTKEI